MRCMCVSSCACVCVGVVDVECEVNLAIVQMLNVHWVIDEQKQ